MKSSDLDTMVIERCNTPQAANMFEAEKYVIRHCSFLPTDIHAEYRDRYYSVAIKQEGEQYPHAITRADWNQHKTIFDIARAMSNIPYSLLEVLNCEQEPYRIVFNYRKSKPYSLVKIVKIDRFDHRNHETVLKSYYGPKGLAEHAAKKFLETVQPEKLYYGSLGAGDEIYPKYIWNAEQASITPDQNMQRWIADAEIVESRKI